jgi:hypothetical protein
MIVDNGIRTATVFANLGVFFSVDNRLEVTSPANNRIDVDTGAALVSGRKFYNDTAIGSGGNITSPAANPRIDRVVVRCNFAVVSYVPANASAADFTVTTNTARITVIHGAENAVPVAPSLTQDVARLTYWDIPLAQYEISVAGVISNLTDEREWVDAEYKEIFIPFETGYNVTDGVSIQRGDGGSYQRGVLGVIFPDNKVCNTFTSLMIPPNFISDASVDFVIRAMASGNNAYVSRYVEYGQFDAAQTIIGAAYIAVPVVASQPTNVYATALAAAAAQDIVNVGFSRDATDPLDTINDELLATGVRLTYLGWR